MVRGKDTNLEQIGRGMTWVYFKYATEPEYFAAERIAKGSRTGLRSQPNAIPPWVSVTLKEPTKPDQSPCRHESIRLHRGIV